MKTGPAIKSKVLRHELIALKARYDYGAVSPAIWAVIKEIEADIAWAESRGFASRAMSPWASCSNFTHPHIGSELFHME